MKQIGFATLHGDTALLLRQHHDRGIVAIGRFTSIVYPDAHEDDLAPRYH